MIGKSTILAIAMLSAMNDFGGRSHTGFGLDDEEDFDEPGLRPKFAKKVEFLKDRFEFTKEEIEIIESKSGKDRKKYVKQLKIQYAKAQKEQR